MRKFILLIFATILLSGCQKYIRFYTDDYSIKLPQNAVFLSQTDEEKLPDDNKMLFSVMVFKKNIGDYYGLEDCISKELLFMMEKQNTYNLKSTRRKINGFDAVITRGMNVVNDNRIYWLVAIYQAKYYYYIIRIFSGEKFFFLNEFAMEKIANSFRIYQQ